MMSEPFILVFSEEAKNTLVEDGFNLLDGSKNYFLFENDPSLHISLPESEYTYTCIMSFVG